MTVLINNQPEKLPSELMTVEDFVKWKRINPQGTAIAVNDKLIKQNVWSVTQLKDMDQITVISAAYGG